MAGGCGQGRGERRGATARAAFGLCLLLCPGATAQTLGGEAVSEPIANWYVDLDAAYQVSGRSWTARLSRPLYDETAAFEVSYLPSAGTAFAAGAGRRLWSNLAVGIEASYLRTAADTRASGFVPHPLFVDQPREPKQELEAVTLTEVGVHLRASWTFWISDRVDVRLAAGPSLLEVTRDRVTGIGTRELGPPRYDVALAPDGSQRTATRQRIPGVNAGIDLTYHLFRSVEPGALFWTAGLGGFARWTRAVDRSEFQGDEVTTVGGWRGGLGFRLRF